MPQALISDVDVNLADTETVHLEAFNHVFPQVGPDWYWSHEGHAGPRGAMTVELPAVH